MAVGARLCLCLETRIPQRLMFDPGSASLSQLEDQKRHRSEDQQSRTGLQRDRPDAEQPLEGGNVMDEDLHRDLDQDKIDRILERYA